MKLPTGSLTRWGLPCLVGEKLPPDKRKPPRPKLTKIPGYMSEEKR